jgi:4-aminobutyrate aminotransferase-like enzyme
MKENILLHFEKSRPDILVFLPSLLVTEKEIKIFLKALEKILRKKIYMLISSFISGNIKDIKNYL